MSNSEEQYFYLLNRLMQGDISEEEMDSLLQLAKDDTDKLLLIEYLTLPPNKTALLEAEIVYEKTKPNDLVLTNIIESPTSTKKPLRIFKIAIVAASLAILLFSYLYYNSLHQATEEWQYITTKRGERKFLTFQDGTEVWLNNESELKVSKGYGVDHRRMALRGEGYFSVAKNPNLPLFIETKDTEVKVLGTVFNLSSYPESDVTTTSLIEGKVSLKLLGRKDAKEIVMNAGDQVEISLINAEKVSNLNNLHEMQLAEAVSYRKVNLKNDKVPDILWVENQLVFNDNTISEIAIKLKRWYNKEIVIENDKLLNLSFSGTFQEGECTQVLDILKKTGLNINYQIKNDTIFIK